MFGGGALPEVVAANEACDEGRGRMFVHRLGIGKLLDMTVEHDGDAVGHRHGFFLVVRDEHEGDAESCL